jgi:hypothetical protein
MIRFSIRDLLWLMVVAALAVSLGVTWRRERIRANERAAEIDLNHKLPHLLRLGQPVKLSRGLTVDVTSDDGHAVLYFDYVEPGQTTSH